MYEYLQGLTTVLFSFQMAEFFMFAGLMFLTVIIFAVMSITYTYVDVPPDSEDEDEKKDNLGGKSTLIKTT